MYKINWKKELPSIVVLGIMLATAAFAYPMLPETVPAHWNIYGQTDAWGSKSFWAFFPFILATVIFLLTLYVPYFDPKKEKYASFDQAYRHIRLGLIVFLAALSGITTAIGLGYSLEMGKVMPLLLGAFYCVIGNFLGKVKQNWFVGIKLPWTLESEDNWNKTHRFGGKCFVVAGIISMFSAFLPAVLAFSICISAILLAAFFPSVYSYLLYKKTKTLPRT
ncbi:MAG: SdpI family protein [bacterium]